MFSVCEERKMRVEKQSSRYHMCGSSIILFYFGRVLCVVRLALPFSILKGSKATYFDIVMFFFFFFRHSFAVHRTLFDPHLLAFGLYEIFVFYVCSEHSVVTHYIRSPFIAARKATITKETTKNNRAKKNEHIYSSDLFAWYSVAGNKRIHNANRRRNTKQYLSLPKQVFYLFTCIRNRAFSLLFFHYLSPYGRLFDTCSYTHSVANGVCVSLCDQQVHNHCSVQASINNYRNEKTRMKKINFNVFSLGRVASFVLRSSMICIQVSFPLPCIRPYLKCMGFILLHFVVRFGSISATAALI